MRLLPLTAMAMTAAATGAVAVLHVVPMTYPPNPIRRTISEYALRPETGTLFTAAMVGLTLGSLALFAALVQARLLRGFSTTAGALLLWCAGLAAVAYFPKHDWSVGPSASGDIHRLAGAVAFVSLPIAALGLAATWWAHPRWAGFARLSAGCGSLSLLCLSPIPAAMVLEPVTRQPWWLAIPLGAVERLLGVALVGTVLALAWWSSRAREHDAGEAIRPNTPATSDAGVSLGE